MSFLSNLLLGAGTLSPKVRAALESEGLVLVDEGLSGSLRYRHFKAPGRRFNGKVTPQVFAIGISEKRLAVYCRNGRTRIIDTPFTEERFSAVSVSLKDTETVSIVIDFDEAGVPKVSGEMEIVMHTPNAALITEQLNTRLGR